jgi:hypothetical protein
LSRKEFEALMNALDDKILAAINKIDVSKGWDVIRSDLAVLEQLVGLRAVLIGDVKPELKSL